jgi:AcrR family transcriptional regulator
LIDSYRRKLNYADSVTVMSSHREDLLDAAITVLGESGIHGLTHRAVDVAAGLPAGSASNHFRTRDALLNAVAERFAAHERANWEQIAVEICPATPGDLARALAAFAQDSTGPNRTLALARYAILVEAAIYPSLRDQLTETGRRVNAWFTSWVRIAGSADPGRDAPVIMNHWTGIVLHQLANPDPAFDPYPQIAALVTAVIRPRTAQEATA